MSAPTWSADRWPTPEEWLDWFLSCSRDLQLGTAEKLIHDSQTAARCFEMNHEKRLERGGKS
jgi:hypothetical protein